MLPFPEAPKFEVTKRGYDTAAVDAHIERMAEAHQASEDRVRELEGELEAARETEEAVRMTFLAAQRTKDELVTNAEADAQEIVAQAKYEAYQTITDSKKEADETISEARDEAAERLAGAMEEAETTVSAARTEAIKIISEVKEEGERLVAEHEHSAKELARLAEEENRELLQQVAHLSAIARDVEARLQAIARGAIDELAEVTGAIELEMQANEELRGFAERASQPRTKKPSAAPATEEPEAESDQDEGERRSLYSRRSANLPRIGSTANAVISDLASLRSPEPRDGTANNEEVVDQTTGVPATT